MSSTSDPFATLRGRAYMNLTTFRKSGQGVVTPVWFAEDGQRLYVFTDQGAGKTKRIRNSGRVELAPSDGRGQPLGPAFAAQARILAETPAIQRAEELIARKYGWQLRLIRFVNRFRGATGPAYLEITPAGA